MKDIRGILFNDKPGCHFATACYHENSIWHAGELSILLEIISRCIEHFLPNTGNYITVYFLHCKPLSQGSHESVRRRITPIFVWGTFGIYQPYPGQRCSNDLFNLLLLQKAPVSKQHSDYHQIQRDCMSNNLVEFYYRDGKVS